MLIINNGVIVAEDSPHNLSARLQSSNRFLVRVGGADLDAVASALTALPDVFEANQIDNGIEVFSKPERDARPAVAAAVVGKKWDLLELRPLDMSLEDIFLQLTHGEEARPELALEEN